MTEVDYYELLEVERTADAATIKSSYRRLAMDCHPDRHGGCTDKEARFKAISQAYDVLKDPQKRAAYDRFGHAAFQNGGGGGNPFGGGGQGFDGFSDIFSSIFGEFMDPRGARQNAARGADLRYDLELTLEEAYQGVTKDIQIEALATCDALRGQGIARRGAGGALRNLRRRGQGPRQPGLLRGRADVPDLRRIGRSDRRSLPHLRRRRARAQAAQAQCRHSRRGRRRHPDPGCRRRRSGHSRRDRRRPVSVRPHEAPRHLPARRQQPGGRMPDQLHHRGAWRDGDDPRHRRDADRPQGPGWRAIGRDACVSAGRG